MTAITAGGCVGTDFSQEIGTSVKALAPLAQGRLIDRVIDAARACGSSHITVVGNEDVAAYCGTRVEAIIPAVEEGRANLQAALRCAQPHEALLLMSSDLPFITGTALHDFLERIGDAEVAMPLASAIAYMKAYPGATDHITHLGNEHVANGSVFYFAPGTASRAIDIASRLFAARKSLIQMARLLDLHLFLHFLCRRLRIEHIEEYAQRHFTLRARAIRDASPTLCYDIDTQADYHYVRRLLG